MPRSTNSTYFSMQSTPLLLRQLLRSSFSGAKSTIVPKASRPQKLSAPRRFQQPLCLRCQFKAQIRFYSDGKSSKKPEKDQRIIESDSTTHEDLISTQKEKNAPNPTLEKSRDPPRDELPSQEESRRSHLSKRFSHIMDNLQTNVFIAGQRLNDLTGYSGIEALKNEIEEQEADLKSARSTLRQIKESYAQAISQRSSSQREVNELLQRKHAWTPTDLERFTSLYRSDHANEQAETATQEALTAAERAAEEAASKLSKTILARYHEEQIWSDKIRRMSTWGTWGLMGVNVLLFLVFQVLVEPWRRKRLVKGFEEKVVSALERENVSHDKSVVKEAPAVGHDAVIGMVSSPAVASETFVSIDPNSVAANPNQSLPLPPASIKRPPDSPISPAGNTPSLIFETYRDMIQDLFSERIVSVSQRDLTTVALEGAVAGAALVGFLVVLLRPK